MGTKERREREKAQRRKLILDAAKEILDEDGPEGLSMRKIARRIEYSPALIYHYFRDKEEILDALMTAGFQKIVQGLQGLVLSTDHPEIRFRQFIKAYIDNALANPEEYRSVLLNSSPSLLKYTSVLYEGASAKESVGMVHRFLQDTFFNQSTADNEYIERTVQIIWTSMFGLIIRVMVEGVSPGQTQRLIEHQTEMMLAAVTSLGQK